MERESVHIHLHQPLTENIGILYKRTLSHRTLLGFAFLKALRVLSSGATYQYHLDITSVLDDVMNAILIIPHYYHTWTCDFTFQRSRDNPLGVRQHPCTDRAPAQHVSIQVPTFPRIRSESTAHDLSRWPLGPLRAERRARKVEEHHSNWEDRLLFFASH